MNHVDFLKHITNLEKDDHVLAIEMLNHFRKRPHERRGIDPFYSNHRDLERNEVHICDVYLQLRELKSHQPNIYQALFLDSQGLTKRVTAFACFAIQIFILFALMLYAKEGDITEEPLMYDLSRSFAL